MQIGRIEAMDEQGEIVAIFDNYDIKPEAQSDIADHEFMIAIQNIASNQETLLSGEFLTKVLRLPAAWRNVASEYINGSKPYVRDKLDCKVTLRHMAPKDSGPTVPVTMKVIQQKQRIGNTSQNSWEDIPIRRNITGGETVELEAEKAIHALWKYGKFAQDPQGWNANSINGREGLWLEEVGYEVKFTDQDGQFVTYNSFKYQRRHMEQTLEAARALSDEDAALKMLHDLPAHIERNEEFEAFQKELESPKPRRGRKPKTEQS
jgi:hypothetical protein